MNTCPLCKESSHKKFPIHYFLREKRFDARKCRTCGFIFIAPRPIEDEIAVMYSDEYFLYDGADCGAHSMTDYETAARKGSVKFPEILGYIMRFKPGGRFFEVGCGMGYFLDYVRSQGFTVSGIEYAELGVKVCREKFNLNVSRGSIEKIPEGAQQYDVVFFGDVLEHLDDPLEALQKAHRLLKTNGIVALEVPSMFNSIVGRSAEALFGLAGRSKKMPLLPYHLNEFTPSTLREMILRAGFEEIVIHQRVKPPSTIALRGSVFEKVTKLALQYPNYVITKTLGVFGDRLVGIGKKC